MIYKLIAVAAVGLAGSVVLVAAGEGRLQTELRPRAAAGAQIAPVETIKPDNGPLPPLPRVSFDPPAPMAEIQQVYEFAAWDTHGIGCGVCLAVGRDAMTLFKAGLKPIAIRAAIDKKYGASSMPTPRPIR
jgi:hypothetical protein